MLRWMDSVVKTIPLCAFCFLYLILAWPLLITMCELTYQLNS